MIHFKQSPIENILYTEAIHRGGQAANEAKLKYFGPANKKYHCTK